ncbi:hypothetical protein FB451DRAFT_1568461 [Mycena latifolia]|nr:hypothetical protein FB451DRAFT_1568461 [Mycena latifolia]
MSSTPGNDADAAADRSEYTKVLPDHHTFVKARFPAYWEFEKEVLEDKAKKRTERQYKKGSKRDWVKAQISDALITEFKLHETQDAERLTTLLESKVVSSSSTSASAAVEADLLSAQAQLAGANAQLVTAQAQPAALQAEFDTALPHSVTLAAGSSQARPPVRSPVRLAPASFRASHDASFVK